jgi:hypothetical protein
MTRSTGSRAKRPVGEARSRTPTTLIRFRCHISSATGMNLNSEIGRGPGFEPGASRSRTAVVACPCVSSRVLHETIDFYSKVHLNDPSMWSCDALCSTDCYMNYYMGAFGPRKRCLALRCLSRQTRAHERTVSQWALFSAVAQPPSSDRNQHHPGGCCTGGSNRWALAHPVRSS